MAFDSFADFIAMGGYGFYVWISFGLSFLSLITLGAWSVWYKKRLFSIAQEEMQRIERIKAARKKRREDNSINDPVASEPE